MSIMSFWMLIESYEKIMLFFVLIDFCYLKCKLIDRDFIDRKIIAINKEHLYSKREGAYYEWITVTSYINCGGIISVRKFLFICVIMRTYHVCVTAFVAVFVYWFACMRFAEGKENLYTAHCHNYNNGRSYVMIDVNNGSRFDGKSKHTHIDAFVIFLIYQRIYSKFIHAHCVCVCMPMCLRERYEQLHIAHEFISRATVSCSLYVCIGKLCTFTLKRAPFFLTITYMNGNSYSYFE